MIIFIPLLFVKIFYIEWRLLLEIMGGLFDFNFLFNNLTSESPSLPLAAFEIFLLLFLIAQHEVMMTRHIEHSIWFNKMKAEHEKEMNRQRKLGEDDVVNC